MRYKVYIIYTQLDVSLLLKVINKSYNYLRSILWEAGKVSRSEKEREMEGDYFVNQDGEKPMMMVSGDTACARRRKPMNMVSGDTACARRRKPMNMVSADTVGFPKEMHRERLIIIRFLHK